MTTQSNDVQDEDVEYTWNESTMSQSLRRMVSDVDVDTNNNIRVFVE